MMFLRFLKASAFFLFVDVLISFLALVALVVIFVGLAKAECDPERFCWDYPTDYTLFFDFPGIKDNKVFTDFDHHNNVTMRILQNLEASAVAGFGVGSGEVTVKSQYNRLIVNPSGEGTIDISEQLYSGRVSVDKAVLDQSRGEASHNTLEGRDFELGQTKFAAGYVELLGAGTAIANHNTVNLTNYSFVKVFSEYTVTALDFSAGGKVTIYGVSDGGSQAIPPAGTGEASHNVVNIFDSFLHDIAGGIVYFHLQSD
ncbi:MAG: hypothetical protein LBF41_08315, partial [Deltaproteobacteria bacterium]|nr:hypothetical protein [Deltaproteobacteria bacterium]